MADLPFWRNSPPAEGPPNPQTSGGDSSFGPSNDVLTADGSAAAWETFLVNGQRLPGLIKLVKAPPLGLHEVFSKGQDRDSQVRKILGLKSPEFSVSCTLLNDKHWTDWQRMRPLLLPVEKADGRGEVRSISYPLVNVQSITYAYVTLIDPIQVPDAGGPAVFLIHWRAWWPSDANKRSGKASKTLKDPAQTATIDIAGSVPRGPQLADFTRPGPARLR